VVVVEGLEEDDLPFQVVSQAVVLQVPWPKVEVSDVVEEVEEVDELLDVHVQDLVVFHFLQSVFQNDHRDCHGSKMTRAFESRNPHSDRTRPAELLR
jgi:hypothetical protein